VSAIETGLNVVVDYTIWFPKSKSGKPGVETWESASLEEKLLLTIAGDNAISFKAAKEYILSTINETAPLAVTLLCAADNRGGNTGFKWHTYISGCKLFPKTGVRQVFMADDEKWKEWVDLCKVSADIVCGIELLMHNPTAAEKRKRQVSDTILMSAYLKSIY
jgi:hypothetical protein